MPPDDSVVAATYRIHRLDALAVRKWWQDPLVAKKAGLHANHGIQQTLTSLLSILFLYDHHKTTLVAES